MNKRQRKKFLSKLVSKFRESISMQKIWTVELKIPLEYKGNTPVIARPKKGKVI